MVGLDRRVHASGSVLLVLVLFSVALLGLTGCVSQRTDAPTARKKAGPALLVGRGDGEVTLKWASEIGFAYTILYSEDLKRPEWKPHPKLANIPGTGSDIIVQDRPARGKNRFYRLFVIPPRR